MVPYPVMKLTKYFSILAALVLLTGVLAGYLFPTHFQHQLQPVIERLHTLANASKAHHRPLYTFGLILGNNVLTSLIVIGMGILFGVFPIWKMWTNGIIMGYVVSAVVHQTHLPAWQVFTFAMLPHGIFEIPALVWAGGIGTFLGYNTLMKLTRSAGVGAPDLSPGLERNIATSEDTGGAPEGRKDVRRGIITRAVFRQIPFIVLLLIVAAVVETWVTPILIATQLHAG